MQLRVFPQQKINKQSNYFRSQWQDDSNRLKKPAESNDKQQNEKSILIVPLSIDNLHQYRWLSTIPNDEFLPSDLFVQRFALSYYSP